MAFKASSDGHHWTINGKSYPHTDPIVVQANKRYRWTFDNQSADPHPVHLHRHRFEIVRFAGQPVSGIWKDVIAVPALPLPSAIPHGHGLHGDDAVLKLSRLRVRTSQPALARETILLP